MHGVGSSLCRYCLKLFSIGRRPLRLQLLRPGETSPVVWRARNLSLDIVAQ